MSPNFIERKLILPAARAAISIVSFIALLLIGLASITAVYSLIAGSIAGSVQLSQPKVEITALETALKAPAQRKVREAIIRWNEYELDISSVAVGDDTDLRAQLVEFATLADPSKTEIYFKSYDLAAAALSLADGDDGAYSGASSKTAFLRGLIQNFRTVQNQSSIDVEVYVEAYTKVWTSDAKFKVRRFRAASAAAYRHSETLDSALLYAALSLAVFISSALALALLLTERNTRGTDGAALQNKSLFPSNLLIAIAALSAFSLFASPLPASAQLITQAELDELLAAELERSKAAAKAEALEKASHDFDVEMEARRSHIGKVYVFNPNGIVDKHPSADYSFYDYPTVASQFVRASCVRDAACDIADLPKEHVLTSTEPVYFEVRGIESRRCITQINRWGRQSISDRSNECFYYSVMISGEPAGLFIGEKMFDDAKQKWYLNVDSCEAYCSSSELQLGYPLADPLTQVYKEPIVSGRMRGYLTEMPEVITARLVEQKRVAAELRAEQARAASEQQLIAKREAAAKKASADSAAAKQRELDAQKTREKKAQELVDKYGSAVAAAISNRKVITGMSQSAVVESWGEPQRKKLVPPDDEMWTYSSGKTIFFAKKKVTSIK